MKLYIIFSILVLFYVPAITGQRRNTETSELSPECDQIRAKLQKNMNVLENVANTGQGIQQKDCNFAKSSVKLTKKYGKCLSEEDQEGLDTTYKNMRFVSKMICENVNKRILGCFSPENLKQFTQCQNKTIQYMDFMAKRKRTQATSVNNEKVQIRKKRFLLKKLFLGDGVQGRSSDGANLGSNIAGGILGGLSGLTESLSGGLSGGFSGLGRKSSSLKGSKSLTPFEERCCAYHLQSECFLTKVLHTCAEKK